jgi:hypothetical protein
LTINILFMRHPFLTVIIILLLAGNIYGFYNLLARPAAFQQKLHIPAAALQWLRWLPLLSMAGLAGLWLGQTWGVYVSAAAALAIIVTDVVFGVQYHLPIAIISTALLAAAVYVSRKYFW